MSRAIWAIIRREVVRLVRQRGRLVSALVRPLIWLLIIGSGVEAMLGHTGSVGYKQFLVPGLLGMVLLFGAMLAALSLVYDKESGVMRMLLIAPLPRAWIVIARTVSAAVAAIIQGLLLMLVLLPLGYFPQHISTWLFAAALVAASLTCASLGMLIAVWSKTLDNFAVIMNFVIFPMFFMSGALYPLEHLPSSLRLIGMLNPFSYAVDLMKHALGVLPGGPLGADFDIATDAWVLLGFIIVATFIAVARFSQDAVRETWAGLLSGH